ncbi:glycoside hydrolase family 6 protein [Kineococcus sp. LSe6-4]|uniref:Glucanase n=1 Tax=Kineococcus halophytocola TaxID=3234027 RepID=A0ABV4GVT5_9ACTN
MATGSTAAASSLLPDGDRSGGQPSGDPSSPAPRSPLAGAEFYADPTGHAPQQLREWDAAGDARAVWLRRLAAVPTAVWFAGGEDPAARAAELTTAAQAAGQVPVLVAYDVPGRDCGLYSDGGAPDGATYLDWVRSLAAGVGDRPAVVVLEPDAVAQALDGCLAVRGEQPQDRYALLRQAVEILGAGAGTLVYLDAGNPGWAQDEAALADALRASGVEQAAGFAVNVSNFQSTQDSDAFGRRLSDRLGGARFVVDTSRNGVGPDTGDDSGLNWCNPRGRSLGPAPTGDTGQDRTDAYLWIKVPGDSDGSCRPGEPAAGTWWPDYALDLVMQTTMGHSWAGH